MEQVIRVLQIAPGQVPQVAYLKPSIEAFNYAVSTGAYEPGVAKSQKLTDSISILYFRDEFFMELKANRRVNGEILFGTFLVVGTTEKGLPRSLTLSELDHYITLFHDTESFTGEEALDAQLNSFLRHLDEPFPFDVSDYDI